MSSSFSSSSSSLSFLSPSSLSSSSTNKKNQAYNTFEGSKDLRGSLLLFGTEMCDVSRAFRNDTQELSCRALKNLSQKIGQQKYNEIFSAAINNLLNLPKFDPNAISHRLIAKTIFCDLFKKIKAISGGEAFLRELFPNLDISNSSNALYCSYYIHSNILEKMHRWITSNEDQNLIKMTSRILQVHADLRAPLANNSFETVHERAENIRIWLQNNNIVLQNITELDLRGLNLTSIPTELNKFINLTNLDLSNNQITQIHLNAFSALVNLQILLLSNNQLTQIPSTAFSALVNLTWLDLSDNQITQIPPTAFSALVTLEALYLSNNQITQIPPTAFSALVMLSDLFLSNNQITQIPPTAFSALVSLVSLDLSNNQITQIPHNAFSALGWLERLFLSNNQITQIHLNAFSALRNLIEFDIDVFNIDVFI